MQENRSLKELFGGSLTEEGKAILDKASESAAQELTVQVFKEDRKTRLLELIITYGSCVTESTTGAIEHEEQYGLAAEVVFYQIKRMIKEGV